jgi:hypothetical protein
MTDRTMLQRRAVEAVVWGMPAVNFERMCQALAGDAGGESNQVVHWSRLLDWKTQTLTPNPDAIYLMPFIDTSGGPVVLEVPPAGESGSITGSIDDGWQTAIEDVGPAGVDKGEGGAYLLLPPDYQDAAPDGYIALRPPTFQLFAILRSNLRSGSEADVAAAVDYGNQIKLYPLSQAADPPQTRFADAADVVFDSTIQYDLRFFESLDRFVQREPWLTRDKAMIDTLRTIGIEKGASFSPDEPTREILDEAAREAHDWRDARYETLFEQPFTDAARWALPVPNELVEGLSTDYADPNAYPVDARGAVYSMGFFSAKHLGAGQFYLMTIKDKAGHDLDGSRHYRLNVPTTPPVKLYWSATAYDRTTHALIRNMSWASRSSHTPGLEHNPDGSIDLHFAPQSPEGNTSNWIPTDRAVRSR